MGFAEIIGAQEQKYTPETSGSFRVKVSKDGCTDSSTCYFLEIVSINENSLSSTIIVYPNPTDENISVSLGRFHKNISIDVRNIAGHLIATYDYGSTDKVILDLTGLKGMFLIDIRSDEVPIKTVKILKE